MVDGASVLTGWPKVDTFVNEEEWDLEAALHLQLIVILCSKWGKKKIPKGAIVNKRIHRAIDKKKAKKTSNGRNKLHRKLKIEEKPEPH